MRVSSPLPAQDTVKKGLEPSRRGPDNTSANGERYNNWRARSQDTPPPRPRYNIRPTTITPLKTTRALKTTSEKFQTSQIHDTIWGEREREKERERERERERKRESKYSPPVHKKPKAKCNRLRVQTTHQWPSSHVLYGKPEPKRNLKSKQYNTVSRKSQLHRDLQLHKTITITDKKSFLFAYMGGCL